MAVESLIRIPDEASKFTPLFWQEQLDLLISRAAIPLYLCELTFPHLYTGFLRILSLFHNVERADHPAGGLLRRQRSGLRGRLTQPLPLIFLPRQCLQRQS